MKTTLKGMLRDQAQLNDIALPSSATSNPGFIEQAASRDSVVQTSPLVKISKFGGELRSWLGFWIQFDSTINASLTLSKVNKFKYLTSYLAGKAAVAVAGLDLRSVNYN